RSTCCAIACPWSDRRGRLGRRRRTGPRQVLERPTTILRRLFVVADDSHQPLYVLAPAKIRDGGEYCFASTVAGKARVQRPQLIRVLTRHVVMTETPNRYREQFVGKIGS